MLIILDFNRLCADNLSIIYIGNAVIYLIFNTNYYFYIKQPLKGYASSML